MRVKMIQKYLATYEGGDLPEPGEVADLTPDAFAQHLIFLGVAVAVDGAPVESAAVDNDVETAAVEAKPKRRARKAAEK